MKLFAFYIGGSAKNSLIELHDARFIAAARMKDCYPEILASWWGTPDSLHLDCWGELTSADGHNIHLKKEPPPPGDRLYFVNLGGYDAAEFTELHKNVFVVAENESKAKVRALKQILHWKSHHKDYLFDVENIACLNDAAQAKGWHIHLEKTDTPVPFIFDFGYNPVFKK